MHQLPIRGFNFDYNNFKIYINEENSDAIKSVYGLYTDTVMASKTTNVGYVTNSSLNL